MRGPRVPALLAIGALLLLAVLSARGLSAVPSDPREPGVPTFQPLPTETQPGEPEPSVAADPLEPDEGPEVVGIVSVAIIALLILTAVVLLVLQAIRRRGDREPNWTGETRPDDVGPDAVRERLRRAAERAQGELSARTGGPPGDAVVAAWLALEDAAAREGAGRAPHQTSTEFTVALLGRHTTDERALDELRVRYQRARFGQPGAVDEQDVRVARTALDRVLRGLRDADSPVSS